MSSEGKHVMHRWEPFIFTGLAVKMCTLHTYVYNSLEIWISCYVQALFSLKLKPLKSDE